MKILMLFLFLLLVGCGHQHDARETTVSFSFEKMDQSLLINPNRFVLFAHDQDRLQRAKVLVPGSNVLTLPNGSWKFSIFGFGGVTVAPPSFWNGSNQVFCGRTDFYNLNGTPLDVPIVVSQGNCVSGTSNSNLVKIYPTTSFANFKFRWAIPQGSRDQIDNEQLQDSFTSECLAAPTATVHMPRSLNASSVQFPYYLILEIYTGSGCVEANLTASIEFDGDISKTPKRSLQNVPRPNGTEEVVTIKADKDGTNLTTHSVNIPL
jgi:hypothetical protein